MQDDNRAEWPISDVVALTGATSRALRHYGDLGLLPPSRVGANGLRYYDRDGLVRLQRILLLRELGLGLPAIGEVLSQQIDAADALERHLASLRAEQGRLARLHRSVTRTLEALRRGKEIDMAEMFDGFDHTRHQSEVERRWGADAYAEGDRWWRGKTDTQKADFRAALTERTSAWTELAGTGASPASPAAQTLARAHVEWLASIPGTPAASGDAAQLKAYVLGLAQLYAEDDRFAANYGGAEGAAFVKAALEHYAEAQL